MDTNKTTFSTVNDQLTQVKAFIDHLAQTLQQQQMIMRRGGVSLPSEVLTWLSSATSYIPPIESQLSDQQIELAQLRALADVSADITTSLDVNTILAEAMNIIITLTNAERGFIITRDEQTEELKLLITQEQASDSNSDLSISTSQVSTTVLEEVLSTGETLLTDNAYKDERLEGNDSIAALNLRSVLCAPLRYKDETLGVVYVDNRLQDNVFTEREKTLLTAFANTTAVAMVNARLYTQIQEALTEITQVNELLDNVFGSIGSGVIATDAENRITTFNRAAEQILEREAPQALGQALSEILPGIPRNLASQLDTVRQTNASQALNTDFEIQNRGQIILNMKLNPIHNNQNRIDGVAVVIDDITAQVQQEEQMRVLQYYLPPKLVEDIDVIAQLELGGERREVTCMFITVMPLHLIPQDTPPRKMMDMVNSYHAVASECIHDGGGVIDKYTGNEIMVLFNTRLNPAEDHALRAIETAVRIRESFAELYTQDRSESNPHGYTVGIHTGIATLGNVGSVNRREFSAIGDTINLAKRIKQTADEGEIIITEATYQHITSLSNALPKHIQLTDKSPIQAKGRHQKTIRFEVART